MPNKKPLIYVLLCVSFWALIPLVSKFGQRDLDNHQFLFWSSLTSLLTFVTIILKRKKFCLIGSLNVKEWITAIFLGLLGTYIYYILLYLGYSIGNGLEVLVLQYTWPIFIIILSIIILKERVTLKKIISIIFGSTGVFIVLTKGDLTSLKFDNIFVVIIVLTAAFTFGLFSILSKKIEIDATFLVAIYFLTATVTSFISMNLLSEFKLPVKNSILPILINGIFVNGISYILWIRALKLSDASFVAPFVFLTPAISTILLIVLFREPFETAYLYGIVSVILSGLINSFNRPTCSDPSSP